MPANPNLVDKVWGATNQLYMAAQPPTALLGELAAGVQPLPAEADMGMGDEMMKMVGHHSHVASGVAFGACG